MPDSKVVTVPSSDVNDAAEEIKNLLHLHQINASPAHLIALMLMAISNWPLDSIRNGTFLDVVQKLIEERVEHGGDP